MSGNGDTNSIDEKKNQDNGGKSPDYKGFAINYTVSIVFTIGIMVFVIGGLGLYTTKVAQANIMPDNIELAPYTILDRVVKNIPIDINVIRPSMFSDNKDTMSQKVIFESKQYLDSFNKGFLCYLKKSADPSGGVLANASLFFSMVYENIIAKNLLTMNSLFFYLSYLPESIIMLLYAFLGIFIWIMLYFLNVCISIFYHFVNIPQLFRSVNDDNKWEANDNISFFRIMKLIMFMFIWGPIGLFSAFISPLFFTLYGLLCPLYATYQDKTNKSYGVTDFIKNLFVFKSYFFILLATVSLFSNGSKYLGNNALVGIVIAVIFAYFMGFYSNDVPDDTFTPKIRQHMRQANIAEVNMKNPLLVKVCKKIPIDDKRMEQLESKGTFRPLSKPTIDGGTNDINVATNNDATTDATTDKPISHISPVLSSSNHTNNNNEGVEDGNLTPRDMNINDIDFTTLPEVDALDSNRLLEEPTVEQPTAEQPTAEQPTAEQSIKQQGGYKRKKNYNIKFT